jgi:thiosulfate reductase cytochrome b subunit
VQIWVGRKLIWPKLAQRKQVRRWHFWLMVDLVAFILAHVILDSALFHVLLAV